MADEDVDVEEDDFYAILNCRKDVSENFVVWNVKQEVLCMF